MTGTRGGFREGSGRKPSGRRKVNFYITVQEEKYLREKLDELRQIKGGTENVAEKNDR